MYTQLFYKDFSLPQVLNCLSWGLIYTLLMSTNPLTDFVKYTYFYQSRIPVNFLYLIGNTYFHFNKASPVRNIYINGIIFLHTHCLHIFSSVTQCVPSHSSIFPIKMTQSPAADISLVSSLDFSE